MLIEQKPYELRMRWLLLLALLINFLMVLFFFLIDFDTELFKMPRMPEREEAAPVVFDQPPPQPPEPDVPEEAAALKPRASVFGAADEEQEEAEFTPGHTDSASQSEDGSGEDAVLTKPTDLKNDEDLLAQDAEEKEQQIRERSQHDKLQEEKKAQEAQEMKLLEELKGTYILQQKKEELKEEKRPDAELQEQAEKEQEQKLAQQAQMKRKTATRHNTGRGKKNATPITRNKLTMADLAKGFLESFKNEGDDWMERDGNPNIRPTQKEMKYLSYMQKVYWHIQNTVKQNKVMVQKHWPTFLRTDLYLHFDRDGTIQDIRIAKPSGCDEYDEYCLMVFRNNAIGYPPIPNHIPEHYIDVPLSIICSTNAPRIKFSFM